MDCESVSFVAMAKKPDSLREPIERFVEYLKEIDEVLHMSQGGISVQAGIVNVLDIMKRGMLEDDHRDPEEVERELELTPRAAPCSKVVESGGELGCTGAGGQRPRRS